MQRICGMALFKKTIVMGSETLSFVLRKTRINYCISIK